MRYHTFSLLPQPSLHNPLSSTMNDFSTEDVSPMLENPLVQRTLVLFGRCLGIAILLGVFFLVYKNMSADRKPDPHLPTANEPIDFATFEELIAEAPSSQLKAESEKLALLKFETTEEQIANYRKRIEISNRILAIRHSRGNQRYALRSRAESRYRIEHVRLTNGLSTEESLKELEESAGSFDSYDDEGIKKYAELSYMLLDMNRTIENEDESEQFPLLQRTRGSFLDAARGTLDDPKVSSLLLELSQHFCRVKAGSKDRTELLELFYEKYRETEDQKVATYVHQARDQVHTLFQEIRKKNAAAVATESK